MTAEQRKRGLGRGLDALFRDARAEEASIASAPKIKRADELVEAARELKQQEQPQAAVNAAASAPRRLPVDKLVPGKYQPRQRFDDAAIDRLAESIEVHGVLQPLIVRAIAGGMFEIIAGERRWRAAQRARVHDVPVVVHILSDKEAMEIALIENLQREDLSAIEEADGYQRLMDEFGHSQETLAANLGKSRSHVANTMRLLKLPASIKDMVQKGTLSAGHARALIGTPNAEALANVILKRGLNVRQVEALVQKAATGKPVKTGAKPKFAQKDVDILALETKLTTVLGLVVTIEGEGQSGSLSIAYKSLEQLDDLIKRLSRVA